MANTTVVDQLIIKFGLDPRDFTKGQKQVVSDFLRAKDTVRKSTDEMSKGVEGAAKSVATSGGIIARVFGKGGAIGLAIAVAIAAGKKLNDELYEVAENTRRLGIDAKNFNSTAAGLRNLGNVAELAGGSIDDAAQSTGGLAKALYDLKVNGQVSESLIMLGRLGVQFQDAAGNARDFNDVTLDTAEALERAQKAGTMSRSDAYFAAQQAGFTGGLANIVADGRGATAAALAKQQGRRQVNGSDVDIGTRRVNANLSVGQAAEANVGVPAMSKVSGLNIGASETAERFLVGGGGLATALGEKLSGAIDKASLAVQDFADATREAYKDLQKSHQQWTGAERFGPAFDAAADKYGVDRAVVRGIARTESNNNPDAVATRKGKVTGRGIMQLNPQYFPNAGKDPYSDIDTAVAHFARLYESTEGTEGERYTAALRMYHAGEANYRNGTNLGPENRAYAGKVLAGTTLAMPTPNAQGGGSVVNRGDTTFEQVNIYTNKQDGAGVAQDFSEVTKRKINASQAETGMR